MISREKSTLLANGLMAVVVGLASGQVFSETVVKPDAPAPSGDIPGQAVEAASQDVSPKADPQAIAEEIAQHQFALEPVEVRAVIFEGVSGELLREDELLGLKIPLIKSKWAYIPAPETEDVRHYRLENLITEDGQPLMMNAQSLNAITVLVSRAYIEAGYAAVRVTIDRDAIDRLRLPGSDGRLVVRVTEGRVGEVRSRAAAGGTEISPNEHEQLRAHSALAEGDAMDIREANRYLAFLNRHPRRRVDMTLSPGETAGEVVLDYLVQQAKPWTVYAQASNTGTEQTSEWREQFGLLHYNLTHHDDILALSYVTGDFNAVHATSVSYERPFDHDPRWRWRLFGDASRYDASEVGLPGADFDGEGWGGGAELKWNFLQYKDWFADLIGGAQYRRTKTFNALASLNGEAEFVLPYVGMQVERETINTRALARLTLETNLRGLTGSDDADVERLGRTDADSDWMSLRYNGSFSRFIDPWFFGPSDTIDRPSQIHEIAALLRGQFVLGDQRVAPNFTSAVGGFNSVRGYPEVFASGDNSVIGSLEYRYHLPRGLEPSSAVGDLWGEPFRGRPTYSGGRTDWDLILRGFVDAGHVWSNDALSFEGSSTLVGAGVGLELLLKQNMSLRADWGFALRDEASGNDAVTAGSSQVHLQFTLLY